MTTHLDHLELFTAGNYCITMLRRNSKILAMLYVPELYSSQINFILR
jgi:hypothetical protein